MGQLGPILSGKIAVVTGASRGIGKAIALRFATEGAAVVLAARTPGLLEEVAGDVRVMGGNALPVPLDVSRPDEVRAAFDLIRRELGDPDILVNNAGVLPDYLPVASTDDAFWAQVIAVNLSGPFYCSREVIPAMSAKGWGRIINIASIAGKEGMALSGAYCASKHGLIGLTRAMARELADKGVTVNAICPGMVMTDMHRNYLAKYARATGRTEREVEEAIPSIIPQGRVLDPEEIVPLAIYLASDDSRGMTGATLDISGGEARY